MYQYIGYEVVENHYDILDGDNLQIGQDIVNIEVDYKDGYGELEIPIGVYDRELNNGIKIKYNDDNFGSLLFSLLEDEFTRIDLYNHEIRTIPDNIKKITDLNINEEDQITDITGIDKLVELKSIFINGCDINNLSELSKLNKLEDFTMYNVLLNNAEFLSNIDSLEHVSLYSSGLEDVGYLENLPNIKNVTLSNDYYLDEDNDRIILPSIYRRLLENNIEVEAYLYIEKLQNGDELYNDYAEELPILTDDNGNYYVNVDYVVNNLKREGERYIRLSVKNGLYENSIFNYYYFVENNGIAYELHNNQKYIVCLNETNNVVKDVITNINFPRAKSFNIKDINDNTLNNDDKLGTGTIINTLNSCGDVMDTYIVVILGDLDGNGEIDIYDPLRLIELVMDSDENYVWPDVLKLAGNCDKVDNNDIEIPDIYDILRLIEYYFDEVEW